MGKRLQSAKTCIVERINMYVINVTGLEQINPPGAAFCMINSHSTHQECHPSYPAMTSYDLELTMLCLESIITSEMMGASREEKRFEVNVLMCAIKR